MEDFFFIQISLHARWNFPLRRILSFSICPIYALRFFYLIPLPISFPLIQISIPSSHLNFWSSPKFRRKARDVHRRRTRSFVSSWFSSFFQNDGFPLRNWSLFSFFCCFVSPFKNPPKSGIFNRTPSQKSAGGTFDYSLYVRLKMNAFFLPGHKSLISLIRIGPIHAGSQSMENVLMDGIIHDNMQPRFDEQKTSFLWYLLLGTDVDEYLFQFQNNSDYFGRIVFFELG